jgi:uncharacterized glyoxalase superfamily protein PhnB
VTPEELENLAHLRRARDLMDREYSRPLEVAQLARAALMSTAHFSRQFRATYAETPYSYLMTRRIERAKALLRNGKLTVTEVCLEVGCWITVGSASQPDVSIVLTNYVNGSPEDNDAVAAMIAKGALYGVHLQAEDLDGTFEQLRSGGAEIVQEPADQPWGVRDGAVRDPSGNLIRIAQPPAT